VSGRIKYKHRFSSIILAVKLAELKSKPDPRALDTQRRRFQFADHLAKFARVTLMRLLTFAPDRAKTQDESFA
jgi:hypothetical protein